MKMKWDQTGERTYETGVSNGALYPANDEGVYATGVPWNGLTTVTESPSGAEPQPQYADNMKYLNLQSAEEFSCTIEAFTYPIEFEACDGTAAPVPGVTIGQQARRLFGFSYQTLKGNDTQGTDYGYKIHIVYGALAAPSEKSRATVNDSPEAMTLSWEASTTAVEVGEVGGKKYKPTSHLVVDSTEVPAANLQALEDILYGTDGANARLPLPQEVFNLTEGSVTEVSTQSPTFDSATDTITVPTVTGVVYKVGGETVTGSVTIDEPTVVDAVPANGYSFTEYSDTNWTFTP